jgi:hypothetical protein
METASLSREDYKIGYGAVAIMVGLFYARILNIQRINLYYNFTVERKLSQCSAAYYAPEEKRKRIRTLCSDREITCVSERENKHSSTVEVDVKTKEISPSHASWPLNGLSP